jgi:hypothetical protein
MTYPAKLISVDPITLLTIQTIVVENEKEEKTAMKIREHYRKDSGKTCLMTRFSAGFVEVV